MIISENFTCHDSYIKRLFYSSAQFLSEESFFFCFATLIFAAYASDTLHIRCKLFLVDAYKRKVLIKTNCFLITLFHLQF